MIFFDLDGTLLDHKVSEYLGINAFYKENIQHFRIIEDDFYQMWCKISEKIFRKYLDGELTFAQQRNERIKEVFALVGIQLSDNEAEKKFQTYLLNYENNWKLYDDVIPCLKALKGFRLGIISNGDHTQQVQKLERMGIKDYFEVIIAAGDVGIAKPDARIFEIACEKAKILPENCYYVGDDLSTDIMPCEKIGITGIWLNRNNDKTKISNIRMICGLNDLKRYL